MPLAEGFGVRGEARGREGKSPIVTQRRGGQKEELGKKDRIRDTHPQETAKGEAFHDMERMRLGGKHPCVWVTGSTL